MSILLLVECESQRALYSHAMPTGVAMLIVLLCIFQRRFVDSPGDL
jgi:hypothetical protein